MNKQSRSKIPSQGKRLCREWDCSTNFLLMKHNRKTQANYVRPGFSHQIQLNILLVMPAAGEIFCGFSLQNHDFHQGKMVMECQKPQKTASGGDSKNRNFQNFRLRRWKTATYPAKSNQKTASFSKRPLTPPPPPPLLFSCFFAVFAPMRNLFEHGQSGLGLLWFGAWIGLDRAVFSR